ncbi:MAG: hypothetical protein MUP63_03405 [Candidatus Nanohaloarchaeota archaeon QJJ-7]|nr:hypothetical protein [Candidatus Nanohaloarchaeota archaeon QJJ-7]
MFENDSVRELAKKTLDADSRFPLQLMEGYHTTNVAAGTPEMGDDGLGFYKAVLDEDYNSLEPGMWVNVQHPTSSGTEHYQMQVEPVEKRTAHEMLSEGEFLAFQSGSALLPGKDDHRGMSYSPRKIDDRIYRETIHKSSLINPGEQIHLWSNINPGELPWEELRDIGHPMEDVKGEDHRIHYT